MSSNTITAADFSTTLFPLNRSTRQKLSSKILLALKEEMEERGLVYVYRDLYSPKAEYTFFFSDRSYAGLLQNIPPEKSRRQKWY